MSNRYQRVTINYNNYCYSNLFPVVSGIPQGSILDPLLFLVWSMICHHISQFLKFADDIKCFFHISTLSDYSALQEDVTALLTWSSYSDLDFNLKKFLFTYLGHHIYYIWHTHTTVTVILIKIVDSFDLRIYDSINTTEPLLHMLTKCWG